MRRVVTTHDTLQLGELAHHARHQVGLGQHTGALRGPDVRSQFLGNDHREFTDTFGLVVQRAQLVMKYNVLQAIDTGIQFDFSITVPEEFRVGKAGTDNAFVALLYLFLLLATDICHGNKVRQQLATFVYYRKIFLVVLHCSYQCLCRYVEILLLEIRQQRFRPLHQAGHFIQQIAFDDRLSTDLARQFHGTVVDALPPAIEIGEHECLLQLALVLTSILQLYRFRGMEAVAA